MEANYALMKEQLRSEILAELKTTTAPASPAPWHRVHTEYERRTRFIDPRSNYKLRTAFCAVVRHRFALKSVRDLSEDQVDETLLLLQPFFELACVPQ